MALNLRLMAYQPNGAQIGILPLPSTFDVGTILNDVSSLRVTYSDLATRSEIFSTPIEVAVEHTDAREAAWVEPDNCRFLLLDRQIDKADESKMATYTLPGYAWQLDKAIVDMTPASRAKLGGKRSFKDSSPGGLLVQLVNEAQARGALPGLTLGFSANADSDGAGWRHEQVGVSFDAGTGLLKVLKSLAESGAIDWCMRGRQLCVFNPNGELAAPRHGSRALKSTSSVSLQVFLDSVSSTLSSTATAVAGPNPADDLRAGYNVLAVAQHGEPVYDPNGYGLAVGRDTSLTAVSGGMPLALYAKGTPPDGIERATGAFVMDQNAPLRWFFACPRMNNSTRPDLLASNAFTRYGSGALLLAETNPALKVEQSYYTGYTRAGQLLIGRGIMCVEVDTFNANDFPTANVVLEGYPYNGDNKLRQQLHAQLANQGFDVRSNVGAYKETELTRVTNNVTIMQGNLDRAKNAAQYQQGGSTPAQRNAIKVAQAGLDKAKAERAAVVAAQASRTLSASIYANEYGASLGAMGKFGYIARDKKVLYARVLVSDAIASNGTWRNRFGAALNAAVVAMGTRQKLPFTNPKGYITDAEVVDPSELSGVSLLMGRDIVEAPTQSSLTDLVARVYAYGDTYTQVVVENPDAVKPWGIWETALASGGVDDTDTLNDNALVALNQGSAERVSMTRGITFGNARFLPFRHYDTGDFVRAPSPTGEQVPMRIHQTTISMEGGQLSGSLVMSDRFLPVDLKRSKAIVAASGGAVGGTLTLGGGVRPVVSVPEPRKLSTPIPKS